MTTESVPSPLLSDAATMKRPDQPMPADTLEDDMSCVASEYSGGLPRADVAWKLKESQRKFAHFLAASEQGLQQILADMGRQHRKYLSELSGLHTNLHQDIKQLGGLKAELSRFACPSALAALGPGTGKAEPHPQLECNSVAPAALPSFGAGREGSNMSGLDENSVSMDAPLPREQSTLTETSLKDHLFMALTPLYGLKDALSSALAPMQDQLKKMENALHSNPPQLIPPHLLPEHPHLPPLSRRPEVTDHGKVPGDLSFWDKIIDETISTSFDSREGKTATPPTPKASAFKLVRLGSHLNFASDLLGADESMNVLSAMHEHRMPGQDRKNALKISFLGDEPDRSSILAKFLRSQNFERLVSLVIAANMIFITYAADYAVKHPFNQTTTTIKIFEFMFQLFYVFELSLKLIVHRLYFFTNEEWHWNWLDFLLVGTTSYDLCLTLTGQNWEASDKGKSQFNFIFLRVLRLARFSKVIRVFRVVRFVNELHVLVRVISSSLRALFWCMVILVVFFYIFAVIFVNGTTAYLASPDTDKANKADIIEHWGSVSKAMVSLYKATTGGKDWADYSDTLADTGSVYYCIFLFFIAFIILALLNILTGIFVDRAMRVTAEDKDGEAMAKLTQERSAVTDLCKLHCVISGQEVEDNASITRKQFEEHMVSPAMRARFSVLGLEIWDSKRFFTMLTSLGDSEEVDIRTFVSGCMQVRGTAQRLGVHLLTSHVSALAKLPPPRSGHAQAMSRHAHPEV